MSSPKRLAANLILTYLRFWAHTALAIHRPYLIGIAGSTGKTSTKHILYAMLKDQSRVGYTYGNSETGVPLGLLGINIGNSGPLNWLLTLLQAPFKIFHLRKFDHFIVEMGTDEPFPPKNMDYLLTILQPDLAIHLNAQPVHTQQFAAILTNEQRQLPADQQQHHIVHAIGFEDAKIITKTQADPAIVNGDDPVLTDIYLPFMAEQADRDVQIFGQNDHDNINYTDCTISADGTSFGFQANDQSITVELPGYVLPQHYQQSIAAALLTTLHLKLDISKTLSSLKTHLELPHGRSSVFPGIKNTALIDSTYNASTASILDMLELLSVLKQQTNRPVVIVLGDMRELGDQAPTEHTKVMQAVAPVADQLFLVGPLTKQYIMDPLTAAETKPAVMHWFETSVQAGQFLKDNLPDNALVLFKGSQNTIFLEEAIKQLLTNPADATKLCRQESHWLKRKQAFFAGVKK